MKNSLQFLKWVLRILVTGESALQSNKLAMESSKAYITKAVFSASENKPYGINIFSNEKWFYDYINDSHVDFIMKYFVMCFPKANGFEDLRSNYNYHFQTVQMGRKVLFARKLLIALMGSIAFTITFNFYFSMNNFFNFNIHF